MSRTRKRKTWMVSLAIVIVIAVAYMSWNYPFSLVSMQRSFTYHPSLGTHNGKTYEEEVNAFKDTYENDIKKFEESGEFHPTVNRTQFILPVFEQHWLIGTDSKTIDRDALYRMLHDVQQARNTLLQLVTEGDYSKEERVYLVDCIHHFLRLEESIKIIGDGTYFSRHELQRMIRNIHGDFWSTFTHYTTVFYDVSLK